MKYRLDLLNNPEDAVDRDPRLCSYIHVKGKKKGEFCPLYAVLGSTRCSNHGGGKPLVGKPQGWHKFTNGARSKYLPIAMAGKIMKKRARYEKEIKNKTLSEKYIESRSDPEILDLSDEIALIDARNAQLLSQVTSGDVSPSAWNEMIDLFDELDEAMRFLDTQNAKKAIRSMRKTIDRKRTEREGWDEIFDRLETRRKLVDADRRRREAMSLLYTAEKVMDLVANLMADIHDAVSGFAVRGTISNDTAKQIYLAIAHRYARRTGSTDRGVLDSVRPGGKIVAGPRGMDTGEFLDTGVEGSNPVDAVPSSSVERSVVEG